MNQKIEQINTSSVQLAREEGKEEEQSSFFDEMPSSNFDEEFKMTISWESSNHFNVVIIQDGFIAFIYRDQSQVSLEMKQMISVQYDLA